MHGRAARQRRLLVFDHLAKTAGNSVAGWFESGLGVDRVRRLGHEQNRNLIRSCYETCDVACGHLYFDEYEGLNQFCRYLTLLRDPVDRVVSWLYFMLRDDMRAADPTSAADCERFLRGDEEGLCANVTENCSETMTAHFCRILGPETSDIDTRIVNTLAALEAYELVGFYHEMPRFLQRAAAMVGMRMPAALPNENVTPARPRVSDIPRDLRTRIERRNAIDIHVYRTAAAQVRAQSRSRTFFFL